MRKKPHESHTLVEPQMAVRAYLDELLSEPALVAEVEPETETTTKPVNRSALEQALVAATEPAPEIVLEPVPPPIPGPVSTVPVDDVQEQEAPPQVVVPDKQARIVTPDWAKSTFQCLSFQVAGVTLAAPLEKLNGIVEINEEITELPGYAPWVIGLLPNRGQNVQVVDVAQIIMPNEGDSTTIPTVERMKFIILLEDGKFGLAADSISQVLSLEADEVRWRGKLSKRPWLAGTVIEHMCALLEVDLLCEQLQQGLKAS
jgi:purine-binding chemotaxis protein CheW